MKLKRMLLRYYPPGIILEYITSTSTHKQITIDLTHHPHPTQWTDTDTDDMVRQIVVEYGLEVVGVDTKRHQQLLTLVNRIKQRYRLDQQQTNLHYTLTHTIQPHTLQLSNIACNKMCNTVVTASYDRTAKVNMLNVTDNSHKATHTLAGHKNVVYCTALSTPAAQSSPSTADTQLTDQLLCATGSFDTTCRVYSVDTGAHIHTLCNHSKEIICVQFSPSNIYLATGSTDCTVCIWNVITGQCMHTLNDHTAEIAVVEFSPASVLLLTASFDSTVCIYDVATGRLLHALCGHTAEITAAHFTYNSEYVVTSSIDSTVRIWSVSTGDCLHVIRSHTTDVLYSTISLSGDKVVSCDAAGVVCIHSVADGTLMQHIVAHTDEINHCCLNSAATKLLTCCNDGSSKLFNTETGDVIQPLLKVDGAILFGQFSYDGDAVVQFSKNNTVYRYSAMLQ